VIDRGKRPVLGIGVNVIDYDCAVARVIDAARSGTPCSVSALAVHGVMTGVLDAVHGYRLNRLHMVVPDGQPVRWALRILHGETLPSRVYGPTLMLKTCEAAAREGLPVYLYGSSPHVLEALENNLLGLFPGLIICGRSSSRFGKVDDTTNETIMQEIRSSGARIVFVGLGCPRQEVFAYENVEKLSCAVMAVGAAFDFHAGKLEQAPSWMQDRGLEWLFRLTREPRRLWRRYIILNPLFCWHLARQWLNPGRFERRNETAPDRRQNYA
jgi:N-acetylglucosaminyldiphosphoundecaprenol N-acetyl-beta-D-mannosaminyltransferase